MTLDRLVELILAAKKHNVGTICLPTDVVEHLASCANMHRVIADNDEICMLRDAKYCSSEVFKPFRSTPT